MTRENNILTEAPAMEYNEPAPDINAGEFQKVIDSRRSVRVFDGTPIPEGIVRRSLENALLAPNSSNLQQWELYRVTSAQKRTELVRACLSQVAAKTAAELIVVVARTATWREHAREMLALFGKAKPGSVPKPAFDYYRKIVPFVYTQGIFSIVGFFKRCMFSIIGLKKPIIREPVSRAQLKTWAVKSTALAAENIMLSFRAYGFDTCPLEGYDARRLKKILGLRRDAVVVMVIAAGKRAPGGIYGERVRFDATRFIKNV